ncbi:MAG TPA: YidC/Oxa1 family membrane protein insertase [Actinomycetota bacterium]|nr:YidC/Oxa1 family membrane protein insertase [Actinomycetota bacterium]
MADLWNGLLQGLGTALSFFYDIIPSYVVAIMLLTVAVRVLLIPLTIKQTRSMQAMQKIQPKIKELQRKYKGNRQKLNEELMKLYKEHQVNPLGGCLPLLLQLPVFFALYQVLTAAAQRAGALPGTRYLPEGSTLAGDIAGREAGFLGINLACSPAQVGRGAAAFGQAQLNCGETFLVALPVYLLVGLMVFTTYYQQRQMQRVASGPQAQQMQLMAKIMPVFLGFISINISAGVLVYWVTTNAWQIGQQYLMLRSRARTEPGGAGDGRPPKAPAEPPSAPPAREAPAKPPKPSGAGKSGAKSGGGKNARGRKKRSKR